MSRNTSLIIIIIPARIDQSAMDCITPKTNSNITLSDEELVYNDSEKGVKVITSIEKELKRCDSFEFSVAFITHGGLLSIIQTLCNRKNNIKGKILTTDYLNFSEPSALRTLLKFDNIETRIYTKDSFHTKGYIFHNGDKTTYLIGSSNITQDALSKNKEWNVKFTSDSRIKPDVETIFKEMWDDSEILTEEWIDLYNQRYIDSRSMIKKELYRTPPALVKPNSMQVDALQGLAIERNLGHDKALIVSATGTGKTFLSAFDVKETQARKVLFLVHREQILDAAIKSYRYIFGDKIKMGKITGTVKEWNSDFVFSTTQSMSKENNLKHYPPNFFDYIICDEAHHSVSPHYKRIIDYYKPKFLLGMTATPERMDKGDVFDVFNNNIAYEIRLQDALEQEILCPFHYFGISDIELENGEIDDLSDFSILTSDERVKHIIEKAKFYGYSGDRVRGLIFCRDKKEGQTISDKLNEKGLRTQFIYDKTPPEEREKATQRLESTINDEYALDYLVSVDVFNEGVDIRSVNQIIMLRPTQSSTIFIQQLGRGLRKITSDVITKEYLVVLDFIGNYTNNFMIPIALTGDRSMDKEVLRNKISDRCEVPGSSTVSFDTISQKRIYDSINASSSKLKSMMKSEYELMRMLKKRDPTLTELLVESRLDPWAIISNYKSLNSFKKVIKGCDAFDFNDLEDQTDQFISKYVVNGKRPHEAIILNELIERGSIDLDSFKTEMLKLGIKASENDYLHSIKVLNGSFTKGIAEELDSLISINGNRVEMNDDFKKLLSNNDLKESIIDEITCGLKIFQDRYSEGYDGELTLFKRYSRADVCRLLKWNSEGDSSTIYGYTVKNNTCPMFVTYNKSSDISKSTMYEDQFVDQKTFSWMTRSNVRIDSKEVKGILDPRTTSYLFIKRDDGDSKDFYYMGRVRPIKEEVKQTTIENDKGDCLPIVNIKYQLESQVPDDIYSYIIS